jgi:hypothetical protein
MANVDWTDPGTSGNWDDTTSWTGLPVNENYPGQSAANGDLVTIGGSNSAYIVTFNVLSATIGSLEIDGGNGANHQTILQMTAGDTLNIVGGVTLLKKDSNGEIDGAGTISATGQIVATGSTAVEGTVTAGTDTTGGVLDLTGTGSAASNIVFAIGTAAPSTLELNLSGGVAATGAISINNVNQTLEIGPVGAVAISATQNVTNGTILMGGGTLTDTSGISFGTTSSSGSLSGFGTVAGTLTMSGTGTANTITATGGNLTLSTAIGSNSGLVFAIGSTAASDLQLNADPGNGNAFTFLGSAGELALTSSAASGFNDSIVGLDVASTLTPSNLVDILGDTTVTVASGQIGSGTTGTVTLSDGAVLNLSGITDASGPWHALTAPDSAGTGTDVFLSTVACYCRGTHVQTPSGEVPIEKLSIGDLVVTLHNEAWPIRWIGRRAYEARFVASNRALLPVLIRQNALDDGVPRRDLFVSPKHAMFLDDVLVPAEQLVNGVSIVRCDTVAMVEYFHIELDTHDIILAEGAPSETFVDCDNRGMFQNADEFARLYPDSDAPTWAFCAPRVEEGDRLQHLRCRLDERLEATGWTTTFDPDLHLVVDGIPVLADRVDDTVHVFRLDSPAREVRIVSRSSVPAELDVTSADIRRLGVNVSRVVLSGDDVNIVVGCRDTSLMDGFHASEGTHRWTDGDARVPAKFLACFDKDVTVEVHVQNHELSYRTEQREAKRVAEKAA